MKALPIRIPEDRFATVAPIHEVVERAGILNSEPVGLGEDVPEPAEGITNSRDCRIIGID